MLGFDYELRRRGFAGNSCQILLELADDIDPERLKQRVGELVRQHPILCSRPARGWNARWNPVGSVPRVRVFSPSDGLPNLLFNEALNLREGELLRFDLIGRTLIFTWSHALMDAKSAEYFLAMAGNDPLASVESSADWYARRATKAGGLRARGRQAWRELDRLDGFKSALPVSVGTKRPPRAGRLDYQIVALSAEESNRVRAQASRLCGLLGDTTFHLAATLIELHRLHVRVGCPSSSYVIPIPTGLRPKGTREPLFSNQVAMVLHQFLPAQLGSIEEAVAAVKGGNAACSRGDYLDAGITLAHLFRRLPLALYMRIIKHNLRGEICSLFFGDTGSVDSALKTFLGVNLRGFAHVPAVTMPPGLGVVFYRFKNQLRFTIVYAAGTLTDEEAAEFAALLRARLLNP